MNARRVAVLVPVLFGLTQSAAADDGVVLEFKMAKGDRAIYQAKSEMKQSQNFNGMTFDNNTMSDMITSTTVERVDEKGNGVLGMKGERLKVKMTLGPLGDYAFDSQSTERDKSSQIGAGVTPIFERISGMAWQLTITPDGEITKVENYAEQLADVIKDSPFGAQFIGGGSNEGAKMMHSGTFPRLPKKAVKPGDTWEHSEDVVLPNVGKMKSKATYRYAGPDKLNGRETAKIEVTADVSVDIELDQMGAQVTGTVSTTSSTATIQFDVAAGRVLTSEEKTTMAGTLTVTAGGQSFAIQNDQTITNAVKYLEKLPD
jgi:hypothetical protein